MDLKEYRKRIDEVDDELLRLFIERMSIGREIAAYKREHGLPVLDSAREKEKLIGMENKAIDIAGPEMGQYANRLFTLLMELNRDYQTVIIYNMPHS